MSSTSNPGPSARALSLPCGFILPNRLAKAAMSEQLATSDLTPSDALVRVYRRWGESGAGLLITGNVMIDRTAMVEARNEVLDDEEALPRFEAWAKAATANGAACFLQLNHPGRQSPRKLSPHPVAPSAVPMRLRSVFATPRELTSAEILDLCHRFARSASLAQRAGFSGIQLHAAHGYLINQFLSPLTNLRSDEWGGDLSGRMRFLVEVVRATRAAVGPRFPIAVKINSADFQRGGFGEEDALVVVRTLAALDVDLLEISGGTYESAAMMVGVRSRTTEAREAYFLDFARRVRASVTTPIMLTGGFRSAAGILEALEAGIDVVGLGRPLILEPDLPRRLLSEPDARSQVRPKRSGWKRLDGMLELYWYGLQLRRLGDDLPADPKLSLWRAAAYALRENRG